MSMLGFPRRRERHRKLRRAQWLLYGIELCKSVWINGCIMFGFLTGPELAKMGKIKIALVNGREPVAPGRSRSSLYLINTLDVKPESHPLTNG